MTPASIPAVLDSAALLPRLQAGEVVVIPTDTLPGFAVMPDHAEAIWSIKQRPPDKPLILMAATVEALFAHVDGCCHAAASDLASQFWPGALTLVLPASGRVVDKLNPGGSSLGCRIPACPATQELLARSGPLATSSANRSGQPAAADAMQAARIFPDLAQLGPQPWPAHSGQASTVLAWEPSNHWLVLREGAVMPSATVKAR